MIGANLKAIVIVKWPAVANKATIPKNKISWKLGVTQKIIAKGAKVIVTMKLRATRISKVLSVDDKLFASIYEAAKNSVAITIDSWPVAMPLAVGLIMIIIPIIQITNAPMILIENFSFKKIKAAIDTKIGVIYPIAVTSETGILAIAKNQRITPKP